MEGGEPESNGRDATGPRPIWTSTTKVVAKFGATSGCSGCVGPGSHTQGCRVRLEKAPADKKASAGVLGAGVGPITAP